MVGMVHKCVFDVEFSNKGTIRTFSSFFKHNLILPVLRLASSLTTACSLRSTQLQTDFKIKYNGTGTRY
jgi:hypothetical protein